MTKHGRHSDDHSIELAQERKARERGDEDKNESRLEEPQCVLDRVMSVP